MNKHVPLAVIVLLLTASLTGCKSKGNAPSGADGTPPNPDKGPAPASLPQDALMVDPASGYDGFEGWGTSLAWWANVIGGWKDETKKKAILDLLFDPAKGLGLNIVRYNIGGGMNPETDHGLRPGGDVPGFEPSPGHWDWTADANQRSILLEAQKRGVNLMEAFSNSPPYWMTVSGSVTGETEGGNNLKDSEYGRFADYLTEVVKHYRDTWGITFRTLDPLNEPSSNWWKKGNIQEGSHFDPDKQAEIITKVGESLKAKGLIGTMVSAPDDNSIDETISSWESFDDKTRALIGQINTHSYNGSQMAELRDLAKSAGKRLWQSEFGTGGSEPHNHDDMSGPMDLAARITVDLKVMQPAAWVYWQAVEDEGPRNNWGFIHANFIGIEAYYMTKQYYTMGQFSKFIRPGDRILPVDDGMMLASYSAKEQRLTVVVRNSNDSDRSFALDLHKFTSRDGRTPQVQAYRTSKTENMASLPTLSLLPWGLQATAAANSITTYVISGLEASLS